MMLTDINVYLSRWPFDRVYGDSTEQLISILKSHGIMQAWAGSFDAMLHRDIASVNQWLVDECTANGQGMLLPFGTVNPSLPDWEEDLRRCHEVFRMPGIRLHPNYHSYALEDRVAKRLLQAAAERGLIVQVAAKMQDERVHHPLMQVPAVDLTPLADYLVHMPKLRVQILNVSPLRIAPWVVPLDVGDRILVDIAMLEGFDCVSNAIARLGARRLAFGTNAPRFLALSAVLKLRESVLSDADAAAIRHENATRFISA